MDRLPTSSLCQTERLKSGAKRQAILGPAFRGVFNREPWQPVPDVYEKDWRQECQLADRIVVNSKWSEQALDSIACFPLGWVRPDMVVAGCCFNFCGGGSGWINGLLLPEVSADAIAKVLRELVANPSRLLGFSARSGVDARFGLKALAASLLNL